MAQESPQVLRRAVLCGVSWIAATGWLYAQVNYGSIAGNVVDPSARSVAGASVTIVSLERGQSYRTQSNQAGQYAVLQLRPGRYRVEIQAAGFQTSAYSGVTVGIDRATRLDVTLALGSRAETITVTTDPPAMVADRAEVGISLTRDQVEMLPAFNRNVTALFTSIPGAVRSTATVAQSENPQGGILTNFNGQNASSVNFLLDGVDNNDPVLGLIIINPTIESVSEVKVTTANFDAEFARAGGAVIEVDTRSGANRMHGSLFEFFQNDALRARDPFSEPSGPAPIRWNQFGGAAAGPVLRNKLFFFADYQGSRQRNGASLLTTTPTAEIRRGDLGPLNVDVFDPATGDSAGQGRSQFPGNVIPASRISPPSNSLLSMLPLPNSGDPGEVNNNFNAVGSQAFDTGQYNARGDYYAPKGWRTFGRYTIGNFRNLSPAAFGWEAGGPSLSGLEFGGKSDARNQSLAWDASRPFSTSLFADFRFGYSRYRVNVMAPDYGKPVGEQLGIPGLALPNREDTTGIPSFQIPGNGGFSMGFSVPVNNCNCPLLEREFVYQGVTNWTKIFGNHTFKWGAEFHYRQNLRLASDTGRNGEFSFAPAITGSPDVSGSGSGVAAFLLGDPSGFTRFAERSTQPQDAQRYMAYYAQDTVRITARFTLSLGLRWDTWFPDYSLDPGDGGMYEVATNEVLVAGVGGNAKNAGIRTQWRNFSPRVAMASQMNPRTILRVGAGRSYFEPVFGTAFNNVADAYPTAVYQTLSQATLFSPLFSLTEGPPPISFPKVPASGRLQLPDGIAAQYTPPDLKYSYVDSWNLSVDRLVADQTTLTISYIGNVGRNLSLLRPLNQAIPGPGPLDPRRPLFALFGLTQDIEERSDGGNSSYNGLQTRVMRWLSANLSLLAQFTWSKTIDNSHGLLLNDALNRSLADFDRKRVVSIAHTWLLPLGPGQRLFGKARGLSAALAGGWEYHGVTLLESGLPFSPSLINNESLNADAALRPDVVPGADPHDVPGGQNRDQWFDVNAFRLPAPYQFGNAGRNSLRGPDFLSFDQALGRQFRLWHGACLTFRWDVFNVFNLTRLGNPNGAIDAGAGSSARITSIAAPMRQQQLGLRLQF
jgi:hypothetical protein